LAPFWHRWSYFAIINLSVFHLADKCFTITNLINLRIILFLEYRKTPETLRFRGILRLDTMLSYDNKSIFRLYYSMIVATRPDPTVRPPSRIAKVRPWLIAIGWISSIVISMLSPGIHISVPSGRLQTPVTSVVLK
jgi:hypothetical protein